MTPTPKFSLATLFLSCLLVSFCVTSVAEELTAKNYEKNKDTMGVVLVAVNWGRQWGCGPFENAQLVSLRFEPFPGSTGASSLELKSPSRLFVKSEFKNYGFLLQPGEYALTGFSVKAAKSSTNVGHFNADKNDLVKEGVPEGGTFTVKSGEVVYIGNFFLDCYGTPIPWRYYSKGREGFAKHVAEFKQQYGFLADIEVIFRLFKTKNFGIDYELPNQ